MVYQFKTMDDERFVLDLVKMRWGRASSILSSPSVTAVESKLATFVFSEEGILIPMGAGIYNLDGRTPKTKGPGEGLCSIGLLTVLYEDTAVAYLQANVPIKQDSFECGQIKTDVKCVVAQKPQPQAPQSAVVS